MSEMHQQRAIDRWLKWWAVLGTVTGYILGIVSGGFGAYQAFKNDGSRISLLENWKEKQEDFNKVIIQQIATLQALRR